MKRVLVLVALISSRLTLACDMERALSETHFVIDPGFSNVKIESKKDLTQFEVSKCQDDTKYILVNANTIYYQDDTARRESVSGQLINTKNNCSIKSEVPFETISTEKIQSSLDSKSKFLNTCLKINISDMRNQKLSLHPSSKCELKLKDSNLNIYQISGQQCLVAVNSATRLQFSTEIDASCLGSQALSKLNIKPEDVDTVIKLWPVAEEKGQLKVESPFGSRYVRYTILPEAGFLPRADKESTNHRSYVGIYSVNINPGTVQAYSMGKDQTALNVNFLVNNLSKDVCQGSTCAAVSNFTSAIAGQLNLYKINLTQDTRTHLAEWAHSVKIPSQFSGLAEIKPENNLGLLPGGTLILPQALQPGEVFELTADFFEPREFLDDISRSQSFLSDGAQFQGAAGDQLKSLPTLPQLGGLKKLSKLPLLPSISFGSQQVADFVDKFNMQGNWTHRYSKVCNSSNQNCLPFTGSDAAFIQMKIFFRIGQQKEIIPIKVIKSSDVFESYNKSISHFAKKVCE